MVIVIIIIIVMSLFPNLGPEGIQDYLIRKKCLKERFYIQNNSYTYKNM